MSTVPGPVLGPCTAWITADDVAACCASAGVGSDLSQLDVWAVTASMLMYEASARQFKGLCPPVTVRPCRNTCGCFGSSPSAGGAWYWTSSWLGGGGWGWRNECGDRCGCGTTDFVRLAGYPVRAVDEVKIDGVALDPSEYRLQKWRKLYRTTDPGPPPQPRLWPVCQDLGLPDTAPGTWSVTYRAGVDPPELGRQAAAQLACQLFLACSNPDKCKLPNRVTKVVRQGVTYDRIVPLANLLLAGQTGLALVDSFIAGYNRYGSQRRPAVYSPDVQLYPARESV